MRRRRIGLWIALVALSAAPPARAHTIGLSTADFDVQPDGSVEAKLTFSSAEPLGQLPLDRDHDGFLTDADLAAASDDLRSFLAQGVEVDADEASCAQTFQGATVSEIDGLALHATFACPADAEEIAITLFYLSDLRRGHREIARLTAGANTVTQVLSGDHRAIALRMPRRDRAAVRHWLQRWAAGAAAGAIAAGFIGLCWWGARRWRGMRATWQNRGP